MARSGKNRAYATINEGEAETAAWRSLSNEAKVLLLLVRLKGRPWTNGEEHLPSRRMRQELKCGTKKAIAAFKELQDRGFIVITGSGPRKRTTYRRTDWPAGLVGVKQATCEFMDWSPRA